MKERMIDWMEGILKQQSFSEELAPLMTETVFLLGIILLSIVIHLFFKKIVISILRKIILKSPYKWDNAFLESKFIHRFALLLPVLLIYFMAAYLPEVQYFVQKITYIFAIMIATFSVYCFLDAINKIYDTNYAASKERPIKGFLQVVKIFLFMIALIIVVAEIFNQSPVYFISGFGALSAIIMLIFKDSILGMVAGVQMATNDMVRIGDWIEIPKYGADGDVIDISLTVVKIENFDRTITTIPAYAFVSDSFKNWRGMQAAGGRRIKRALYLDAANISFCSEELLAKLEKIHYLEEHIRSKKEEIEKYNKENRIDSSIPVNGRHLTNIGVFRAYIKQYLKNHPKIHKDMIMMVRQLAPGKDGIPMEIYAFTNDTAWENYEGIMADIFDHLFAIVPYFELSLFQEPSGNDIRALKETYR
jgi:miniconductance mechanosensitive channel